MFMYILYRFIVIIYCFIYIIHIPHFPNIFFYFCEQIKTDRIIYRKVVWHLEQLDVILPWGTGH